MNNEISVEDQVVELISREVGERVIINGGRDYDTPTARVVPSTYINSQDHEKALHISQGKGGGGISISLATLDTIMRWAKGEK